MLVCRPVFWQSLRFSSVPRCVLESLVNLWTANCINSTRIVTFAYKIFLQTMIFLRIFLFHLECLQISRYWMNHRKLHNHCRYINIVFMKNLRYLWNFRLARVVFIKMVIGDWTKQHQKQWHCSWQGCCVQFIDVEMRHDLYHGVFGSFASWYLMFIAYTFELALRLWVKVKRYIKTIYSVFNT